MKRLAFISLICLTGASVYAQDTTKTKQHLNEFGIDATGFLKQYLDLGSQQYPSYYNPTYYLTYRRHFSCGNLRVQIGGDFSNDQEPGYSNNDTSQYFSKGYTINASLGWEFYSNLSKKWQVYYGADLRASVVYSNYDENTGINTTSYLGAYETKTQIYGFAPFLGIRFKLTKRLSILTEASYALYREQDFSGTYYIALPNATGPLPQSTSHKYIKTYTGFSQPLDVFIDFTI